jgi:hypothetical protein
MIHTSPLFTPGTYTRITTDNQAEAMAKVGRHLLVKPIWKPMPQVVRGEI